MNTQVYPFNKLKVRQAVEYAINRPAMIKAVFGGLGRATQNVLPPGYPSFHALHLYTYNPGKARALIKAAGANGVSVTVWGRQVSDSIKATELYASYLDKIGLKTSVKLLPRSTYYTTIGTRATKAQTGWARWLEDYPNPIDWFDILVNGEHLHATGHNNYSYANFPSINRKVDALKIKPVLTPAVNRQWAAVDSATMKLAIWAPWTNRAFTAFWGKNVGCHTWQLIYEANWAVACRK